MASPTTQEWGNGLELYLQLLAAARLAIAAAEKVSLNKARAERTKERIGNLVSFLYDLQGNLRVATSSSFDEAQGQLAISTNLLLNAIHATHAARALLAQCKTEGVGKNIARGFLSSVVLVPLESWGDVGGDFRGMNALFKAAFEGLRSHLPDSSQLSTSLLETDSWIAEDNVDRERDITQIGTVLEQFAGGQAELAALLQEQEDALARLSDGMLRNEAGPEAMAMASSQDTATVLITLFTAACAAAPLVELAQCGSPRIQQAAVQAMSDLAAHSGSNVRRIIEAGAVPPLMQLLESSTPSLQEAATSAIRNLAANAEARIAIAAANAIPQLVGVLRSGTSGSQEAATRTLICLADNHLRRRLAIAAAGAIPPLVQQLQSTAPATQEAAASALRNLATGNATINSAILAAGALPPLVQLLQSSTPDSQEAAAWALNNLAYAVPNHQDAIVAAGAVTPLGQCLRSTEEAVQAAAVVALSTLAANVEIIKPINSVEGIRALLEQIKANGSSPLARSKAGSLLESLARM